MSIWQQIQSHVGVAPDGVPGPATAAAIAKALGLHSAVAGVRTLEAPEFFFDHVRKITGPLEQVQVDIINRLLSAASHWSIGWLAYGLATAWHEARLKPIEEWGKGKGKPYGKVNSTGKAPYGRGLVQLTWHGNYERADDELGLGGSLVKNYDRALEPEIAVKILVQGMERGWFTGKSLGTYITPGHGTHAEFVEARRIINGTDKQELIAGYADRFKDALVAGGWSA
jgi:putative chitinase